MTLAIKQLAELSYAGQPRSIAVGTAESFSCCWPQVAFWAAVFIGIELHHILGETPAAQQ